VALTYTIRAADRAAFVRCRRQWDFLAKERRDLEATQPTISSALARAFADALAVYYFPGMWDWPREVVLPLVRQAWRRALERARPALDRPALELLERAEAVLEAYLAWAPGVDRFSPVRVEAVLDVHVPDPTRPGLDLCAPDGRAVMYRTRVDLVAVDERDRYWIVLHRVRERGPATAVEELLGEESAVEACWAWERAYPGVRIAGTIHNEIVLGAELAVPAGRWVRVPDRRYHERGIRQHEPSGGGRSVPQHRRAAAAAEEAGERVIREAAGPFARTRIVRSPDELEAAALSLGLVAREMTRLGVGTRPRPSRSACPSCAFRDPCIAMSEGGDAEALLRIGFARRTDEHLELGRIGTGGWGGGRGAALPPLGR
jgi:hypothetical protein